MYNKDDLDEVLQTYLTLHRFVYAFYSVSSLTALFLLVSLCKMNRQAYLTFTLFLMILNSASVILAQYFNQKAYFDEEPIKINYLGKIYYFPAKQYFFEY